ncbi:hypothetical protein IB259_11290 [Achromobacter sp. ACM04]|uniref:hypothetical protein n=1 Tax=Achromobacter sp. ACM04 TaxID=2769312 RepID=UPI00177CE97F|nr:hypothetical protein [Achromobacter sp. ACM04]MBD9419839.1 hypothetical protein [Achromobacter sp. ACM04]
MPNADTTIIDRAKEAGMSLATLIATRGHLLRGVPSAPADEHIPGDTTTPPAPGVIWIGSGDA